VKKIWNINLSDLLGRIRIIIKLINF
jgi:hypothetical protein